MRRSRAWYTFKRAWSKRREEPKSKKHQGTHNGFDMCVYFVLCCFSQRVYSIYSVGLRLVWLFCVAVAVAIILLPASAHVMCFLLSQQQRKKTQPCIKSKTFLVFYWTHVNVLSRTEWQSLVWQQRKTSNWNYAQSFCCCCALALLINICLPHVWMMYCAKYVMALKIYRFSRCVQFIWIIQE